MTLKETYTDGAAAPEWVKEGGTVAVCQRTRWGVGHSVNKGYVERLTKTQVILNDGQRFSLKNGLRAVGDSKRDPYGPGPLFLADWESKEVKSALREQFLRNAATQIAHQARAFEKEPTGQKAHELMGLLAKWLHKDGTVVEYGVPVSEKRPHEIVVKPEADARRIAESEGLPIYMRAPGVLSGKWVAVAE
ncbi:hypothetical protein PRINCESSTRINA_84 [Arthrobacter phage PrincessTrina]|uniref:Uncharacterized protein n=1 Tax=Arthrobacter phage PrincessTrina TaxID=1772328 RepID=A0A0U4KQB4_9CAUD|nr:hypothetical protein FDI82_gp084 [Arthrobacter phage PrincessTrina]ALY09928.1 hypothetical protein PRINCESSTRINA_84 [Arthrobacter phage PrincessTrina]